MSKIIEVTSEDIRYGTPQSANSCPIARAVKRAFPGVTVSVDASTIIVDGKVARTQPPQATFVRSFDDSSKRDQAKPHKFVLPL